MDDKTMNLLEKMYAEMQIGFKKVDDRLNTLEVGQQRIENKLDVITEQTEFLTEFRTEVNGKLDTIQDDLITIEGVSGKNLMDIAILKKAK